GVSHLFWMWCFFSGSFFFFFSSRRRHTRWPRDWSSDVCSSDLIVSTDVGDVREVIAHTKGCYVCDADVESLLRRLESILVARERTDGRAKVQHLTGPLVARNLIRVYQQVLEKRACPIKGPSQHRVLIPGERTR